MTRTYHDVEAVTRLLEEKEKDLELAAKIGQELLQRNKESDEKILKLENDFGGATELITKLRHELQVKTDLLHVYTSDLEDASPLELRSFNVEILQKKISDLEKDNKTLHEEASKLADEAYACEEKEEKLVKDAVQHLTQANSQIKDLHSQFTHKVDESSRQREEINSLLSQVCDLQNRVQRYSHENDDLTANLRVYQETQDELTTELVDLKDKYREVVELLRDANEEIKRSRKKTYPGMGKHAVEGMFSLPSVQREGGDDSLQAELHSSLRSSKKSSKYDSKIESEVSDSDTDLTSAMGSSAYRKAARTYRAIAKSSAGHKQGLSSSDTSKAVGASTFQSYTISRENSFSPEFEDFEYPVKVDKKFNDDPEVSDDSGHGRSTRLSKTGSLSSSAPNEELARELLRQATRNAVRTSQEPIETSNITFASSQVSTSSISGDLTVTSEAGKARSRNSSECPEVIEVQTIGVLKAPSFQLSSSLLQSTPLGSVPGKNGSVPGGQKLGSLPTTPGHQGPTGLPNIQSQSGTQTPSGRSIGGHPTLGIIPGRTFSEQLTAPENIHRAGSDFDETEPLGQLTMTNLRGHPGLGAIPGQHASWSGNWREDKDETESCTDAPMSFHMPTMDFDETEPLGSLTTATTSLGYMNDTNLRSLTGGHPGLGSIPSNLNVGSLTGGHPGLGTIPGGYPGLYSEDQSIASNDEYLPMRRSDNIGQPGRSQLSSMGLDLTTSWSSQNLSREEFNISSENQLESSANNASSNRSRKGEPFKFSDSGVISGDYSEDSAIRRHAPGLYDNLDIDALSDGGFSEMGTYPGIRLASDRESSDPLSMELESALKHLNPAEVERRRKLMGRNYSYDLGTEGLDSPGAIAGCEEYFKSLPYGVDTPGSSSLNSDRLFKSRNSSSFGFRDRRLPDKLRIIKPIEGSLTLHNWSRLATPHLGGVLEERCGVAIKGNAKAGLDPLFEMYQLSDLEEDEEEDLVIPSVRHPTHTYNTLTNSTVLHPDTTFSTNSYGGTQMSSGVPSRMSTRPHSRMTSRAGSFTDLPGMFADSNFSNIGLSKLLNEKNLSGARRSQLNLTAMSSISSLTPSVLTSPNASKNISPTGTPLHTPEESLPGSPDESSNPGVVYSFFSSLKAAIYGEQRREHRSSKFKRRMGDKRHNLRIMEAVEEVGIESMFSGKEGTPMSLPPLSTVESNPSDHKAKTKIVEPGLSDFDARYLGVLDDFDELEDITPGFLTLSKSTEPPRDSVEYTKQWIGQLTVPSFSATGRPSLQKRELGKIPLTDHNLKPPSELCNMGGRGPGRIVSPGEMRPNQMSGLGVPGHPGTGALGQAIGSKRNDLGTIPGINSQDDQFEYFQENRGIPQSSSFIGSFTNMFFGRKGGY